MSMQFKNPPTTASTIGSQIQNHYYVKKALVELPKLQYFSQLADVTSMPKNFGKKIKRYHYMPLLDDRNVNDQGIDASGAVIANGNLYGTSKDIGTITQKLPALSETGGRVNRVGFKRIELEGTLEKFGFFDEYTQESLDFDTDEQLMEHINREMLLGANEITEDALQIDLINSAGVVRYAGSAVSNLTVDDTCVVTYGDLMRVSIQLDQNRCPKQTKVITGSRMIDTKTIPSGRVAYIGTELIPVFKGMVDLHNNPAFIGVERYGNATVTLNGEIGSVDQFRLVVVPEMMKWAGAGADASGTSTCYETANKYDVFPILVVGDESFTTIGFQTDGKSVKFKIMHKAPGEAMATKDDPYGETGFMSIKWYYGFMVLRPERIALIKTVGKL
jgi:N4-gp56 family major capsid protein